MCLGIARKVCTPSSMLKVYDTNRNLKRYEGTNSRNLRYRQPNKTMGVFAPPPPRAARCRFQHGYTRSSEGGQNFCPVRLPLPGRLPGRVRSATGPERRIRGRNRTDIRCRGIDGYWGHYHVPALRGSRGTDSSSTPSSFGEKEVPRISSNPPGTLDSKRTDPPSTDFPWLRSATSDHGSSGSTTAFFKESMKRDVMIGLRTVLPL